MVAPGPVFISYSRKDFYFAESLAFHLQRASIPVWLDAKDLEPGADWQEQLELALDQASCVLVVISGGSAVRPAVRLEWERALRKGKRIIVVMFRRSPLPLELAGCEVVNFRSSFDSALRLLIRKLAGSPPDAAASHGWLPAPPWILAITLTLLVPLLLYFALGSWNGSGDPNIILWLMVPIFVGSFLWFLCLAFLRRKMGMTHLAVSFAFPAIWCVYPLVRYFVAGPAGIADTWRAALERNPAPMEIGTAVTLAGISIVFLLRPDDLLRWTPTGKAWGFYREGCLARFAGVDRPSELRKVKHFTLLHQPCDGPAAKRLRQELRALGATESLQPDPEDTTIVLLTSRTETEWLTRQADRLRSKVLTVVGTRIGLPEQFEWLWKREWIDFRHWDLRRLDRKRGFLQVPEAVTGVRYPASVRVVHHLICAALASVFCLLFMAEPEAFGDSQATTGQQGELMLGAAICLGLGILGQRLLNRTVTQADFERASKIALAATYLFGIRGVSQAVSHGAPVWRLLPFIALWLALPWALARMRDKIAFWYPTLGMGNPGLAARLRAGRQGQTLLWSSFYLFVFGFFAGMYKD